MKEERAREMTIDLGFAPFELPDGRRVGLIDIMMVGQLGSDAIAAVGYASQFLFLAISVLFAGGFACDSGPLGPNLQSDCTARADR